MPETQDWAAPQLNPVNTTGDVAITASEAGQLVSMLIGIPSRRYVVVSMIVTPDPTQGDIGVVRDWIVVSANDTGNSNLLARSAISPESPQGPAFIPFGFGKTMIGAGVSVTAQTRKGSGSQGVIVNIGYYQTT